MKDHEKFLQRTVVGTGLPGESIPGVSLVEMFGTNRVLIEKHCGITGYSDTKISVRTTWGEIVIEGHDLKIVCMSKQQLIITGCIVSAFLNKRS